MTTVLFADRDGSAFGALSSRTVPALLPLQAVPTLERSLEALVKAGRRSALLVVGPRAGEITKRFGKGIRWGIALEYVRREEGESCGDVLRRLEPRLDGDTLVLRGDVGAHELVGEFLQKVAARREPIVAGMNAGRPAGIWRIAPGALKKIELPREPAAPDWTLGADHAPLQLEDELTLLDSVMAFRRADRAAKPAVSPRATVDPKAVLGPGSTVAEDAMVAAGVSLTESSILPRTVIPSGVVLENVIVSANLVIHTRSRDGESAESKKEETSLLTDLLPPRTRKMSSGPGLGSRLTGALLLVLSAPLWPMAYIWSLVANAGQPRRGVILVGNADGTDAEGRLKRAPFHTFRFETAVPVLRDLPLLLAVVSGRLALQGVAPLSQQEESVLLEPWEKVRWEAPVALLSRSHLTVPASAPPEVGRLVDAFEARRGVSGLVVLGFKNFFSARGWTAAREFNPDLLPEEMSS
jgi:hypothetical protein